jgi:hypothetical protein
MPQQNVKLVKAGYLNDSLDVKDRNTFQAETEGRLF